MNIGKMNKRVILKLIDLTPDSIGGNTSSEVIVGEIWARLQSISSSEQLNYGLALGSRSYKMTTRFNIDVHITQQYLIEFTDSFNDVRKFRIVSVINPDENDKTFELIISERTD